MQYWLSSHFFQDLIQNFLKNSMIFPFKKLKEMAQKLKFLVVLTTLIIWKTAQKNPGIVSVGIIVWKLVF